MPFLDLPDDVLTLVFVHLEPKDFLALCRASRLLYDNYQTDSSYWRIKTSDIFRTPISPLLKADGARWYHLFRRLRTQTRLYTWGQGLKGNLAQGVSPRELPVRTVQGITPRTESPAAPSFTPRSPDRTLLPSRGLPHRGGRFVHQAPRLVFQRTTSNWPTEAHVPDDIGAIADLQCGGWSTIILSSAGRLHATGSINSSNYINVGSQTDRFERLEYLTQSTSAISSFSAGRSHVLALTDDNDVISWDRINAKGLKIRSRVGDNLGKATNVVAGWAESSAYIPDVGIVYWLPLVNDQDDDHLDARPVKEKVIPNTARFVHRDGAVFGVIQHIVLEGVIIYITNDSKIFAVEIGHTNPEDLQPREAAIEIPGYFDGQDQLKDIQGGFRHFVVFTESGRVLAGNVDYIRRCFDAARKHQNDNIEPLQDVSSERPPDIPVLQKSGVIAVRFGDWHYHALYNDGTMTSHGHEPQSCGALGFGDAHLGGKLRGLTTGDQGMRQDSNLRPVADIRGRQVWFEPEKREWLQSLQRKAEQERASDQFWNRVLSEDKEQTIYSEWIEQEGRHWGEGPQGRKDLGESSQRKGDFHLDAHFVLAIGAAGWHSGALVLVDEEKAQEVKEKWLEIEHESGESPDPSVPGHFPQEKKGPTPIWSLGPVPRIQLPAGVQGPQSASSSDGQSLATAAQPWRDGMPTLQDLGLSASGS